MTARVHAQAAVVQVVQVVAEVPALEDVVAHVQGHVQVHALDVAHPAQVLARGTASRGALDLVRKVV